MATRRNFFKYLGLAGGVATGGVVAAAAVIPDTEKSEAVKKIQNNSNGASLHFEQTYRKDQDLVFVTDGQERHRFAADGNVYSNIWNPYAQSGHKVSVKMQPGPDGEMYLNINGKWRRIVTE